MARPSSPRTTQPLCIALVAVAPRGSSPGRRPDLADTPFAPLRLSSPVPRHGRSLHGRAAVTPHPQPLPHLSDVIPSSATTSSSSPSSHAAPEALLHLQRRRFRPRVPVIPSVDSPDPVPPLPRQQHQKNRGEPLHRFPHASLPNSPPSRINHRSRALPAAGHVAAAVATPARRTRARRRAQRFLRKPQIPPVLRETRRSA